MFICLPKLRSSNPGIIGNSASAAFRKQVLGSIILLQVKKKIQNSGQGPSLCTTVWRVSVAEKKFCLVCSALIFITEQRSFVFQAKLSALHTTRLHASAKGSSSGHLRGSKEFQEDQDVKCHCHRKASRTPSADSSCPETRSNSIQEFAESFEKQLHLKSKRSVSLVGNNQLKITTEEKSPSNQVIFISCVIAVTLLGEVQT